MSKKKKKIISNKERNRRMNQAINPAVYLDGEGGSFRMHKKAKNTYQIY